MITTVQPGKIPNSPETHFPLIEKGEKDNKSAHAPHPRQLQGCGVTVSFVGNCFANCKVLSQGMACCLNGEEFSASAVLAVRPADPQASWGTKTHQCQRPVAMGMPPLPQLFYSSEELTTLLWALRLH